MVHADTDPMMQIRPAYARWAERGRGLGLRDTATGIIIRIRPAVMLNLAVVLCIASGLGIFALASLALSIET